MQKAVCMEGTILIHIYFGDLCVRVWFDTLDSLAVDMLLCPSFVDRFIRAILLTERKVVPWDSYPVTIHATTLRGEHIVSNA